MEREAARIAALSPAERTAYEARLSAHRAGLAVLEEIAAERARQMDSEGWSPAHDDEHRGGELAQAAACYARWPGGRGACPSEWPWHPSWYKPTTPRRDLVKAAALLLAEIERIDRSSPSGS